MPRYFFNHRDGGAIDDDIGLELVDDAAARREVMRTLPDVARDLIPKEGDRSGLVILVTDSLGQPVYAATLTFTGVWLRPGGDQ